MAKRRVEAEEDAGIASVGKIRIKKHGRLFNPYSFDFFSHIEMEYTDTERTGVKPPMSVFSIGHTSP